MTFVELKKAPGTAIEHTESAKSRKVHWLLCTFGALCVLCSAPGGFLGFTNAISCHKSEFSMYRNMHISRSLSALLAFSGYLSLHN